MPIPIFLDFKQNIEQNKNKYLQLRLRFGFGLWLCLPFSASEPASACADIFYSIALEPDLRRGLSLMTCNGLLVAAGAKDAPESIVMSFDPKKYLHSLETLDIPDASKLALIHSLHVWAQGFVDRAFDDLPAQRITDTEPQEDSHAPMRDVQFDFNKTTQKRRL